MEKKEAQLEYLKEKQKTYTELLKVWTALTIATTGGIVGLLFKLDQKITLPLIGLGAWLDSIFIMALVTTLVELNQTLREIKKWTKSL